MKVFKIKHIPSGLFFDGGINIQIPEYIEGKWYAVCWSNTGKIWASSNDILAHLNMLKKYHDDWYVDNYVSEIIINEYELVLSGEFSAARNKDGKFVF